MKNKKTKIIMRILPFPRYPKYPKKSKKDILLEILSLVNELLFLNNFPESIIEQKSLGPQLRLDMKNNVFSRLTKEQQTLATTVFLNSKIQTIYGIASFLFFVLFMLFLNNYEFEFKISKKKNIENNTSNVTKIIEDISDKNLIEEKPSQIENKKIKEDIIKLLDLK